MSQKISDLIAALKVLRKYGADDVLVERYYDDTKFVVTGVKDTAPEAILNHLGWYKSEPSVWTWLE